MVMHTNNRRQDYLLQVHVVVPGAVWIKADDNGEKISKSEKIINVYVEALAIHPTEPPWMDPGKNCYK